jgi:multidrug efflux pump subunit AcrA (membrane-fusion protein)
MAQRSDDDRSARDSGARSAPVDRRDDRYGDRDAAAPRRTTTERTVQRPSRGSGNEPTASTCLVTLVEERNVPAEEAGVLTVMNVREGDEVTAFKRRPPRLKPSIPTKEGDKPTQDKVRPLAEIDKSLPMLQRQVALKDFLKADEEAKNDVNVRYADATSKVAKRTWDMSDAANLRTPGSVSPVEIDKLRLEYVASTLKIEQSRHDQNVAVLTAAGKEAELANAEQAAEHRDIHSPIDGVVVQIYAREGEWVKPGDPVFRIINLKRLRVQANLNVAECNPADVVGKTATVSATLTDCEQVTFNGQVTFVQPEVKTGGRFTVWAEVENRKADNGQYVLLPGMQASMTVHTHAPATARADRFGK